MDSQSLVKGFGERLRTERIRLSLTQEALAEQTGVKQQTIHMYERGKTSPTLQFVYKLQDLGFNLPYLLHGREQVPLPSNFPPEVFQFVADMVTEIEKKFSGGSLSNETRLRMLLILLGHYVNEPSSLPLSDIQSLELLVRS